MSLIVFVQDAPILATEVQLVLDGVANGELSVSHTALSRYMPASLLPIGVTPPKPTGSGAGDAAVALTLLTEAGINQPTVTDAWVGAIVDALPAGLRNKFPPSLASLWTDGVVLVADAGHCKAAERFGAARGVPLSQVLCTGRSTLVAALGPCDGGAVAEEAIHVSSPVSQVLGRAFTDSVAEDGAGGISVGGRGVGVAAFLTDLGMSLRELRGRLREPVVVACPSLLATTDPAASALPLSLLSMFKSALGGTSAFTLFAGAGCAGPPLMMMLSLADVDAIIAFIASSPSPAGPIQFSDPPAKASPTATPPLLPTRLASLANRHSAQLVNEEKIARQRIHACLSSAGVPIQSIEGLEARTSCISKCCLADYFSVLGLKDAIREATTAGVPITEYLVSQARLRRALPAGLLATGCPVAKSISHRCFARVGLMGNPSDQLNGKSIAVTIRNFWADAHITFAAAPDMAGSSAPCVVLPQLRLVPNPIFDQFTFGGLGNLSHNIDSEGYSGGMRLMQATCKRFFEHCSSEPRLAGALAASSAWSGFSLTYHTNIPRQVGLAGSSAIIVSILKCLLELHDITIVDTCTPTLPPNAISQADVASLALSVEMKELGIHAGLMDRVAQVYGGLVAMDFGRDIMRAETDAAGPGAAERGRYERLPLSALPAEGGLLLAYARDPSDSGKIHANVKERWSRGDEDVHQAARTWASFVDQAVEALHSEASNPTQAPFAPERLCELVDANFDLRFKIYGEPCLGWKNVRMVTIARRFNAAAKFCGSGGAVIVLPRPTTDTHGLQLAMEAEGFVLVQLCPVE